MKTDKTIAKLERIIGYEFNDYSLLLRALTHSSAVPEGLGKKSYERLEYLGDAVLELLVTRYLFLSYNGANEGDMTKIRAATVSEAPLTEIAKKLDFGRYIILGHGMDKTGGRELPSILSDVVEAILGAIYLDGGIDCAEKFIMPHIIKRVDHAIKLGVDTDYKTKLQEHLQQKGSIEIDYRMKSSGPAHNREHFAEVFVEGKYLGKGTGKTKKQAQQQAAKSALLAIEQTDRT